MTKHLFVLRLLAMSSDSFCISRVAVDMWRRGRQKIATKREEDKEHLCFYVTFPLLFSLSPPPQNVLLNKLNCALDYKWLDGCHVDLFLGIYMGRTNRQHHQIVTSDNPLCVFWTFFHSHKLNFLLNAGCIRVLLNVSAMKVWNYLSLLYYNQTLYLPL